MLFLSITEIYIICFNITFGADLKTIGECTRLMDPDTWNAYHIISNRARSVCYATRQQHFRRQTEYTINRLSETSQNQLLLMYTLQVSKGFFFKMYNDDRFLIYYRFINCQPYSKIL